MILRSLAAKDRIPVFCAIPVGLLGLIVTAGWLLHEPAVVDIRPGLSPMMFNTAVGLVLAAVALPGLARRSTLTAACGALLILIGGATMVEYAGGRDVGIDQMAFRDWHGGLAPGRMGLNTAGCFVVFGLACVLGVMRAGTGRMLALPAGIGLLSVSAAALLGYATGLEFAYHWGGTTRMSVHTAAAFLLLGAGTFASGWPHVGRKRQAWLALACGGCVAGITLVVSLGMLTEQRRAAAAESRAEAVSVAAGMAIEVDQLLAALTRLHERWAAECAGPCEADVAHYLRDYPDLISVGWVDSDRGRVAVFRRLAGAGSVIEAVDRDVTLSLAEKTAGRPSSRGVVAAIVMEGALPVLVVGLRSSSSGPLLLATVDPALLLERSLQGSAGRISVGLTVDGHSIGGGAPGTPGPRGDAAVFEAPITGLIWQFRVSTGGPSRAYLPDLLLLGGMLIACFVATTAYLWQTSGARLKQIRALNADLEGRVADRTLQLRATNAILEDAVREEREALVRLREQEQQQLRIFDAGQIGTWTRDLRSRAFEGHGKLPELFGLESPDAQTLVDAFLTAVHPDDLARVTQINEEALAGQRDLAVEFRVVWPDGTIHWLFSRGDVVRDDAGTPIQIAGVSVDITARKEAELALEASNETLELRVQQRTAELADANVEVARTRGRLQAVLDAATQISIIATDRDGLIRVFNRGAERMFQYQAEEMVGVRTPEILHEPTQHRERAAQLKEQLARPREGDGADGANGRAQLFDEQEWIYVRKDGSTLDVNLVVTAMRDADGVMDGYLGIATDITARKRLETELRLNNEKLAEQTRRAEDANQAKSDFLAAMSHEIRTPMNGVVGMTELLLLTPLSKEQRDYAAIVLSSADSLLTIINDILDFSKVESGKMQLETIEFVLRTSLEEVVGLLAERAQAKGLEMACLIHHDVPLVVRGDPGRLRQVVTNLLGNAIKFTTAGEVVLRARLAEESGDDVTVRFEISDTGIGISPEERSRLFQSFSQADGSTTRKYGGTGLGLAISKRLAELMGGEIGIESEPGRGSTFWFTVKLGKMRAQHPPAPTPRDDLRGLHVLAVDDNETNLQIVCAQASAWGMACHVATRGAEALEMIAAAARTRPYDVVILDMQMPGMDGLALARAITGDPANATMKLVLMTSMAQRGLAARSEQVGIAAYLTKPVRQAQLYECLRTVMGPAAEARAARQASPPTRGIVTAHTLEETRDLRRPRVLLAEDNRTNQMAAVLMLTKLGYQVDVAVNGLEAVEACRGVDYGLVLMDNQMPEMDGLTATREIRTLERAQGRPRVPIVAVTANAMQGDREKCMAVGMDDYLSKPFKVAQLKQMLEHWGFPGTRNANPEP